MKKEIMRLVNSDEKEARVYRLNNVSFLRRWNYDGLGNRVDILELFFDNVNGVNYSIYNTRIKSRDYEGIMQEIEKLTEKFFKEVTKRTIKDLKAGYSY